MPNPDPAPNPEGSAPHAANPYHPSEADRAGGRPPRAEASKRPWIIVGLVVLLLILHQDNWFWTDNTLLLGFFPIALFWHACISIGAALTWLLATKIAWPIHDAQSIDPIQAADQAESGEGS